MHSYDEFKLEQALMTQLYSRQENSKRKPFETYSYFDYLKSKWCCCGSPQHGKYVKAQKMLDEELDVLLIAKQLRLLRALANEKYTKQEILAIVNHADVNLINDDERQSIQDLTAILGVPLGEVQIAKEKDQLAQKVVNASDDFGQ